MADATHISLKVKLDEDIRRFSVQKDISFADLHSLISKHFVLAPENVQIKYIDDEEELITLGSDLELQEAKRLQPTVLRLNVYDVKSRRTPSDQPLPQLMALFVRDVTVPDGTSVTANVKFQKVWRVKNTGTATWPKGGVVLKMVDPKDDQLRVLAVGTITRAVGPDEETDIGVELQAPSRPGRCVQYWRLFAEDGSAFGSRLWVDITVVQDNAAAEKELAEQEEARRLAEQEEQLRRAMAEQLRLQLEEERKREEEEAAALRKTQEEAEQLRREEEEEKARLEEELVRQMEELKRQLEEDERRKREEEEAAAAAEAEAAAALKKKQQQEEEDAKKRQEEAQAAAAALKKKQQEEEEAKKRQAEAAAALKKQKEEEAAAAALRKKQEEEEAKKRQLCSKYPGQLTALAEMGFTNVEHNVKLLDKHKGSLDLALEALLSGH